MIQQYCGGRIPKPTDSHVKSTILNLAFTQELGMIVGNNDLGEVGDYNTLNFSGVLQHIERLISNVDGYLVQQKPWAMAKDDAKVQDLANVLYDAAEALRIITILIHPIMPESTEKIWKQLGQPGNSTKSASDKLAWDS